MTIHPKEDHDDPCAEPQRAGSVAVGPIGFGHKAHQPDPAASYGFEPGPKRTLPEEEKQRWRVPG